MEVQNIRIDLISPSPLNPRKTFDEVALQELASNIEKQGLLQPITVRVAKSEDVTNLETGDVTTIPCSYEIVCGERRFRAVSLLKEKEDKENVAKIKAHRKKSEQFQAISCIVREMTDDEAFEAMITENLQRKDVDPIEEAFAFAQLAEKGRTLEDIALKIGKSTRFVFDRIKLNSLIPELKERVRNGDIPLSGAMILSKLDEDTQKEFHEEEEEQCTTAMIREFVSNSFMELGNAPWIKDDSDNWENTDIKSCSQCENNTCNHGCLFYEMNSKDARCINAACYEKKQIAYVTRKIQLEYEHLVKVGEPLSFGKTVIIARRPDTYWGEDRKVFFQKQLQREVKIYVAENNKTGLFAVGRYGPITQRGLAQSMKVWGSHCGIDSKKMHPHAFRHFFAKMFLKKTKDVIQLADLLGHGSVDTTRIYLQKSYDEQQRDFNKNVTW